MPGFIAKNASKSGSRCGMAGITHSPLLSQAHQKAKAQDRNTVDLAGVSLQRHLQNILFYHKGLGVRNTPLPFVAGAWKAAILRRQIWSAHESDVVDPM